ncbi:MAG TPA: YsnF/AvaK domain-containing protein [Gemmatimonadales bacterium]
MMARNTNPSDVTPGTHGRTVVGLFRDRSNAESAIRELKDAGFTENQIGVAMRNSEEQRELMEDTGSTAAEGAAVGAVSGGVVGGLIGLLGSLLIPGVGPIVVGGVLASTLAGAGIGAAAGGIIGALMGLGVPEADARHFDEGIRTGGVLVTVDAGDRIAQAISILQHSHADLGPSGVERFRAAGMLKPDELENEQRIRLREEQLTVDKERVQAGEVRVRKEVVTEQQNIEVPVQREEVVIERRPVAEAAAPGTEIGEGKEVRIPLSEERINVEKRPVVREEIDVGKRTVTDTRHVSDDVKREEARIETEGSASVRPLGGRERTPYKGKERRRRRDTSYAGPERREAQL